MALQYLEDAAWILEGRIGGVLMGIAGFSAAILAVTAIGRVMPWCDAMEMALLL